MTSDGGSTLPTRLEKLARTPGWRRSRPGPCVVCGAPGRPDPDFDHVVRYHHQVDAISPSHIGRYRK